MYSRPEPDLAPARRIPRGAADAPRPSTRGRARSRSSGLAVLHALAAGSSASATGACTAPSRCGPRSIGEVRVSHLTPLLCLLAAIAWRYRDTRRDPRASRSASPARSSSSSGRSACGSLRSAGCARRCSRPRSPRASLLLVLPFTGLDDYFRTLLELGRTFDQDAYSPFGLLCSSAPPRRWLARSTFAIGAALLVGMWRPEEPRAWRSRPPSFSRRSCGSTSTRSLRSRSPPSGRGSPSSGSSRS